MADSISITGTPDLPTNPSYLCPHAKLYETLMKSSRNLYVLYVYLHDCVLDLIMEIPYQEESTQSSIEKD